MPKHPRSLYISGLTTLIREAGFARRSAGEEYRTTLASFARFAVVAGAFVRSGTSVGWSPRCVWSLVRSTGPRSRASLASPWSLVPSYGLVQELAGRRAVCGRW